MESEKQGGTVEEAVEELAKKPPEELAAAVQEESKKEGGRRADLLAVYGVVDVEFTKPLIWSEKTWDRAHMDFTKLTGTDIEAIDDEIIALSGSLPSFPANNRKYQRILAAKASGIPSMAIAKLPAADYNAMVSAARNFLIATAS